MKGSPEVQWTLNSDKAGPTQVPVTPEYAEDLLDKVERQVHEQNNTEKTSLLELESWMMELNI